jgi:hypothetical protein
MGLMMALMTGAFNDSYSEIRQNGHHSSEKSSLEQTDADQDRFRKKMILIYRPEGESVSRHGTYMPKTASKVDEFWRLL